MRDIFICVNNGAPTLVYGSSRSLKMGVCGKQQSKGAGKWHFSEVVGIVSPSWVTAKCDYLSCAGKVQPLHKPVFIRCCLLWWCFADVLDHTLQCSLSLAFCHPPTHFGWDTLDFHCGSVSSFSAVKGELLWLCKRYELSAVTVAGSLLVKQWNCFKHVKVLQVASRLHYPLRFSWVGENCLNLCFF